MKEKNKYLVWFNEISKDDIDLVGGKGANLGEMVKSGFPVPNGFIVTSEAYYYFLIENNFRIQIKRFLQSVDVHDPRQLNEVSQKIRQLILKGKVPADLAKQIIDFYDQLSKGFKHCLVAVRSSATAEDLPGASFAGQQETFLNIQGEANLINNVRSCWASLFTPRAIFYREEKKFDHFKIGIAVPIQKMIQSENSGVMFTVDPITNDKSKIIIEAIYGLGELIVQGAVTPDHYEVDKRTLKIIHKQINRQEIQLIKVGNLDKQIKVKESLQKRQKISDEKIISLADFAKKIHQHYFFPQDIEWAIENNKIYILQTRPVTTINQKAEAGKQKIETKINLPLIIKGDPASPGISSGYARVIKSSKEIGKVKMGEVLVTEMTTPDFVPAMKKAVAIITDKGGQTSHAAIVSRELGLPCVVGTEKGTKIIKNGLVITVNGKTGEVFKGGLNKQIKNLEANSSFLTRKSFSYAAGMIKTATKIYVNLGEPELAQDISQKNVDGVGLLRAEFMISQMIGVHPKKLIKEKKEKLFIEKLSHGLAQFCQAFNPRPVVYRTTDFKTNEYKNLIGGKEFEIEEPNPMLGYRGCFRYIHDEKVFELELAAIKYVRNKLGLKNLWLMIPFVRKVEELQMVKRIIASHDLVRSPSFKLWMMAEIPSNVILLEDFIKVGIDGVSIGSNDLTMLILGIDRDNETVAPAFNEQDKAVLWALEKIIRTCHKYQITSSICGQAPSVYPELTQKLVDWGISSISVSPDAIEACRELVYLTEKRRMK